MENKNEYKSDCEVCTKLIKEKHRFDYLWKIACVILAALVIVLSVLYFGSGAIMTETTYKINNTDITNNGDDGTVIIGNDGEVVLGTSESIDYMPILCISMVVAAALIVGGIIIANHNKKSD